MVAVIFVFLILILQNVDAGLPLPRPKADNPLVKPPAASGFHCKLSGWWKSDAGLAMYIIEDVPRGYAVTFDGYFFKNDDKKVAATIFGARTKITQSRDDGTFGFVVSFPAGGTAVWIGQCYSSHDSYILKTLLLHRYAAEKQDSWLATRIASQTWTRKSHAPSWFDASKQYGITS